VTVTIFLVAFYLWLSFANTANAHPEVRLRTEESIIIHASPQKVWSIIKNFSDMSWHPSVKSVTSKGDNTEGATHVLTLQDNGTEIGTITEELLKYDDAKMMYKYKIVEMSTAKVITHEGIEVKIPVLPASEFSASIRISEENGGTEVEWKAGYAGAFDKKNPPPELDKNAANIAVQSFLKKGLANLKQLAEK
jgi:mxaD protein